MDNNWIKPHCHCLTQKGYTRERNWHFGIWSQKGYHSKSLSGHPRSGVIECKRSRSSEVRGHRKVTKSLPEVRGQGQGSRSKVKLISYCHFLTLLFLIFLYDGLKTEIFYWNGMSSFWIQAFLHLMYRFILRCHVLLQRDEMLSPDAVSFHYVQPHQIYMFDFLLYELSRAWFENIID